MPAFHIWREDPPPPLTRVAAKWNLLDTKWQEVTSCRHGCCVHDDHLGSMTMPRYWREIADAAVMGADAKRSARAP